MTITIHEGTPYVPAVEAVPTTVTAALAGAEPLGLELMV